MSVTLERIAAPADLPAEWDTLAENYWQRRRFLSHAQQYNPCQQRYYVLLEDGALAAGAVVYTLRLDMLTFLAIPSPIKVQIVGIPCSVSAGGIIGSIANQTLLLERITQTEGGFLLCLNIAQPIAPEVCFAGRTLPTVLLQCTFNSWDDYLHSLRSAYRRRLLQLQSQAAALTITTIPCHDFDAEMYRLYEQVYQRSKDKLEKLPREFFANLPAEFTLTTYAAKDKLCGWTISLQDGDAWFFFLGGRNYAAQATENLYFCMLVTVLQQAMAAGVRVIDFGQTAEIPKMRLGGELCEKFMLGHHSKSIMHKFLHQISPLLCYTRQVPPVHVFQEGKS